MIKFNNVSKKFGKNVEAVKDLSLEIQENELLVFLGTSGSGKTTCIKMVNRLEEVSGGNIFVEGKDIQNYDPIQLRRRIGYAVQHIGLFPHLTVGENIATVPRLLSWDKDKIDKRNTEMLQLVELEPGQFIDRYPYQLSGGQKQRIGVARALAADPDILLMDEPFGAIDPITRFTLQDGFLQIQRKLKKTTLFVTHDMFEAIKLGDRIALMDKGKLQQLDKPDILIDNPANKFVEDFLGSHRFQLALLTKKIRDLKDIKSMTKKKPEEDIQSEVNLKLTDSLLEAINLFKISQVHKIGIYDGETLVGVMKKETMVSSISQFLGKWIGSQ
ncbi:MAG: ATP-binding cassette domain-containing protein [bacterium]